MNNMRKLLISALTIGIVAATILYGTNAFFSDTETSTGNTFQAGAIDLQVDNTSYYNGVFNPGTSWTIRDLTVEKFFNFLDIKPGDHGEDTISIHVNNNPAYACINFRQTENSDNGFTEPEDLVDGILNNADGTPLGDLGNQIFFDFWLDDGDNVLEVGETKVPTATFGPTLGDLFGKTIKLVDSIGGVLGSQPLDPNKTYYLAKFWCYGSPSAFNIRPQDNLGYTGTNGPDVRPNFKCDGQTVTQGPKTMFGNIGQTDKFVGDISFYAVQARNNPNFVCSPALFPSPTPTTPPTNGNLSG